MAHDILKNASSEMYQIIGLLTAHAWQMFPGSTVQMSTYTDPEEDWSKLLFEVIVPERSIKHDDDIFVMEEKFIDVVCDTPAYEPFLSQFIFQVKAR
jgi:hypothetical protein